MIQLLPWRLELMRELVSESMRKPSTFMNFFLPKELKTCCLFSSLILTSLIASARQVQAAAILEIGYTGCHESIGVQTIARAAALPLLPADYAARYGFGGFGSTPGPTEAQIIIRSVNCGNAAIDGLMLGPVVNSQIGVITARSDAEDVDGIAGNGIDNFQLDFATSSQEIAAAMSAFGMPAAFDADLSLVFSGVNVSNDSSPLFTAQGSHELPTVPWPGGFIADWWSPDPAGDIRSRQVIPAIDFSFGGGLTVTPGTSGSLLALLGAGPALMEIPLGGRFATGPVTISVPAVPGPFPIAGAGAALAWSRRLRRRLGANTHGVPGQQPSPSTNTDGKDVVHGGEMALRQAQSKPSARSLTDRSRHG